MFAVVVRFQISPKNLREFMPLMHANATTSLTVEDGCHQFDVATDPHRPGDVFLYELYTDAAAFEHHKTTAHFADFDTKTRAMIVQKDVQTYAAVTQ
ncbi:MAG: putative quinol monooxygenase [Roseobacter sp.]